MPLNDIELAAAIEAGSIAFDPPVPAEAIQPVSIDLRLGGLFLGLRHIGPVLDSRGEQVDVDRHYYALSTPSDSVTIAPGQMILGHTLESIRLDASHVAQLVGRSSLARMGVQVHISAGLIDPGFEGQITLEIVNLAPMPVKLYFGAFVCQVVIDKLSSPCARPYGTTRASHYVGKTSRGPIPPRTLRRG